MKRIERILKFTLTDNYENARKVADDMIVALIKNTENTSTYASSVTLSSLGRFIKWCQKSRKSALYEWDTHRLRYVIEVYKTYGNRKSGLSVSCNEELKQIITR